MVIKDQIQQNRAYCQSGKQRL